MYDVLCTGLTSCDLIFAKLEKFPELGKEMACEDFLIKAGGAANTPVALTKLGLRTAFCTTLGSDIPGDLVYECLKKTGLDMSSVIQDSKYRTSVSAVLSVGRERGFATYFAEGDNEMMIRQIEKFAPHCSHIHTYIHDCLAMPVVEIAKKYNKTLSIDTAWDETIKLENIKHIVEKSDVFLTNEVESCSIAGTETAEEALEKISKYAKVTVVKLGSKGSIVKQGDRVIRVPVVEGVEPLDTTGAGDLYGAGFVYGFVKGWDMEKAAKFATASGNLAVTFYGGMDESYSLENVLDFYNRLEG